MSKKSDLSNIFESYVKGVVLNEAVKDTETSAPTQFTAEQEANIQKIMTSKGVNRGQAIGLMRQGQDVTNAAQQTATQQPAAAQPTTIQQQRPQAQSNATAGSSSNTAGDVVSRQVVGSYPVGAAGGYKTVNTNATSTPVAASNSEVEKFLGNQQASGAEDGYSEEDIQRFLGEIPPKTGPEGGYSEQEINNFLNSDGESTETATVTQTPVAASDEEFAQDDEHESEDDSSDDDHEEKEEENDHEDSEVKEQKINKNMPTLDEKKMIAKFLKQLSEKNYASTHKYLKTILAHKVNKALMRGIERF